MSTIDLRHYVLSRIAGELEALKTAASTWAGGPGETDMELLESICIAHAAALRAKAESNPIKFANKASRTTYPARYEQSS